MKKLSEKIAKWFGVGVFVASFAAIVAVLTGYLDIPIVMQWVELIVTNKAGEKIPL